MNIYELFTRSGRSYFVAATMSFRAINLLERTTQETVQSWIIAPEIPSRAVIINL